MKKYIGKLATKHLIEFTRTGKQTFFQKAVLKIVKRFNITLR
jgi:hypothetical protein